MNDGAFLDVSRLTKEDFANIKLIMQESKCDFQNVLWYYMQKFPNKIKVVGEVKDGNIIRDEITMDGVSEFKGQDALNRIVDEIHKNKAFSI